MTPNSTGYPCYHSLIVGQLFLKSFPLVATLYHLHNLHISGLASSGTLFQPMAPPNLLKSILFNTGRASVVKNDTVSN